MQIQEIKNKLIKYGFEIEQSSLPRFDPYTGKKLPEQAKQTYSLKNDVFYRVIINLDEKYGSNGIFQNKYSVTLYLECKDISIKTYWDLFVNLLKDNKSC
jgi:hypothetical protein